MFTNYTITKRNHEWEVYWANQNGLYGYVGRENTLRKAVNLVKRVGKDCNTLFVRNPSGLRHVIK